MRRCRRWPSYKLNVLPTALVDLSFLKITQLPGKFVVTGRLCRIGRCLAAKRRSLRLLCTE
jgi:hypothetical protein